MNSFSLILLISLSFAIFHLVPAAPGLLPLATRETENDLETNAVTEMESDPEHPSHTAITAFLTSNKLKQDLKATKARLSEVDEFGRNTNALTNHLVNVVDNEKKYNDKQHGIHRDNQGILKAQGDQNEMDIGELRVDHEGLVAKHENLDGRFNQHEQVNANEHGEMVKGIRKNEGGIVKLNEEVTSQDARLTVNEAGLDDLGKKHGNLEKTVEGHGGRLGEAERRIGVHDTEITGLHETDTTLGGRIEGAEKEHRRFVNDEFVPHVQNVNGKFETVGKDISGLDGRTKELGRVQGEHGTSIFNLETNLGNEERDRIRGDDMLSQKIIDETTPIRDQANRVEASLGQTIDKVDKNTGMLGTHGEKLDSHHGRLSSAERRLGENDGKFVRHVNRIKKRKHDILTIRQRFVQLYGNMDKLAEMQQNIDGSMMSMEEEFASNLAQGQERVVEANKALAEANQQVVQTIENYVRSLRHSQKSDGPIGQMHDERAQLIRAQFKLLDEEEKERVQRQLAKITNTQGESQAVETE